MALSPRAKCHGIKLTFPLADVADAHRTIMSGHSAGKIALIP
jgi:hypothetical protein